MTIETRPDQLNPEQVKGILDMGATRVEIGVQAVFDEVLKRANRAHDVRCVREATRSVRDHGLKVGYHMMPGLPGMTDRMERENFSMLFEDEDFRPDMLKIYPTLIMPGTPLFEMHRRYGAQVVFPAELYLPAFEFTGISDTVAAYLLDEFAVIVHGRTHPFNSLKVCAYCCLPGGTSPLSFLSADPVPMRTRIGAMTAANGMM